MVQPIKELTQRNCVICADKYTSERRKPVKCPKCQFECCTNCLKRQCLNNNDSMCMNTDCRAIFSQVFLYSIFPVTFVKGELRKHRACSLLEHEMTLMNTTMPYVEEEINNEIREKKIRELNKIIADARNEIWNLRYSAENNSAEKPKLDKKNYLKRCPVSECRGFLNCAYRCGLCDTLACSRCFEPKDENHVCDEDMVKTAELLRKDTKSCPNCFEMIHKIEGCSQMYCVSCHTGFNWGTGQIVTGVIHNPHYFEYMNRNGGGGRTVGDIPCGGVPHPTALTTKIQHILSIPDQLLNRIQNLRWVDDEQFTNILGFNPPALKMRVLKMGIDRTCQLIQHIRQVEIPLLQVDTAFHINLSSRISYMMNKIDKDQLKASIIRKDSSNLTKTELSHIFTTCATLLEEQMRKIVDDSTTTEADVDTIMEECMNIMNYINECFQDQAIRYKKKMPEIIINQGYIRVDRHGTDIR